VLCYAWVQAFVAPLPLRALPGVGYKAEGLLKSWGVATAADARAISKQQLVTGLGDKHGELSCAHTCLPAFLALLVLNLLQCVVSARHCTWPSRPCPDLVCCRVHVLLLLVQAQGCSMPAGVLTPPQWWRLALPSQ
jgi:hypothetical protein